jgi:hypothetical protein
LVELPEGELSSWKEIAAYLGVGLRTAQIWEQERALPVHRLPGGRGRVIATVAELDAWKRSGALHTTEVLPAAPSSPATPEDSCALPLAAIIDARRLPSSRDWWRRAAWLGVAALVVLGFLALRYWPGKPVSCRVERDTLVAVDNDGRECWRKPFPYPLIEANSPELASMDTWVGDLDGDGRNEVLFAPHSLTAAQESTPLICYNDRGVERWRFVNRQPVRTSAEEFTPIFGLAAFLVTPRGTGLGNVVLVASTHYLYYPSQVVLLAPDGRLLAEYWHSGHLNRLQAADLDNDGKTEFYLAGINNAWHAATLVVLDQDHFAGASKEPETPDHELLGFQPGNERNRIIFPRSCLNTTFNPYNPVATFNVNYGEIVLQTTELIGAGAGIFHHLSPDLHQHRVVISDSYRVEYQRAKAAGLLSPSCKPEEPSDLRILPRPALE